jgi:hypothetical protein
MANNFWSNSALEPKRAFRFLLQLSPIESYVITKVNRPSFEIGESEHKFINHTFYYPGRVTWNEVSFSLVDAVMPDSTGILMKMLMASGYRFPTNSNVTRAISKAEAVSSVGNVMIHVLGSGDQVDPSNPEAEKVETWTLKNPWIKNVSMGDLDYGSDDILSMDVTLRYDWAQLSIPKLNNQLDPARNAGGIQPEPGVAADVRITPKGGYAPVFKVPDGLINGSE